MPKQKRPAGVEIEWLDAWTSLDLDGTVEELMVHANLTRRITRGWMLGERAGVLLIAADYDPPRDKNEAARFSNITAIPLGWVLSIKGRGKRVKAAVATPAPATAPPADPPTE